MYYANEVNFQLADRIIDQIISKIELLSTIPETGRVRKDIAQDVRSFPIDQFNLYYKIIKKDLIQISRIIHASRDQKKAYEKKVKGRG